MPRLGKNAEKLIELNAELKGELDARQVADAVKAARLQDVIAELQRGFTRLLELTKPVLKPAPEPSPRGEDA